MIGSTPLGVIEGAGRWSVTRGESLDLLRAMPDASVDALITDPPYSSGGQFRGDRAQATGDKYVGGDVAVVRQDFAGDNRDQRSFGYWCALWLSECLRICRPGAPICVFTDWRQLPVTTDAVQAGGWIWRGIAPWDKTEASRPRMGGFRSQAEFAVWGTKGAMDLAVSDLVGVLPGVFRIGVRQDDKFHQTGKPTELMRQIVAICPPAGIVLDPFAGSGTTLIAALLTGRRGIGIEQVQAHAEIAAQRCRACMVDGNWREPEQTNLFEGRDTTAPGPETAK